MPDYALTVGKIRPLPGALIDGTHKAGESLAVGDAVKLQADGTVVKHTSDAAFGVVVSTLNKTAAAAPGEEIGICVLGWVTGFAGLTPGKLAFLSSNAGKLATTGTKPFGYNRDAETLFILPGVSIAASS